MSGLQDIESGFPGSPTTPKAAISNIPVNLETLDEPVSTTILRDLKHIGTKIFHVLVPYKSNGVKELRNWDLWGPLLLCLVLAVTLSISAKEDQTALVFAAVFVIVWVGAGIVTVNALLLGGNLSFFQCVCVLGYCIAPLNIASILGHVYNNIIFKLVVVCVSFIWATRASVGFMAQLVPNDRKVLAVYPIFLFYFALGWMILVQ